MQIQGDVSVIRQNDVTAAYQAYQEEMQRGGENPYVLEPKRKVSYVSRLQVILWGYRPTAYVHIVSIFVCVCTCWNF